MERQGWGNGCGVTGGWGSALGRGTCCAVSVPQCRRVAVYGGRAA